MLPAAYEAFRDLKYGYEFTGHLFNLEDNGYIVRIFKVGMRRDRPTTSV